MRNPLPRILARVKSHDYAFMVGAAILIGILGGLGAVGFRWLIHAIQRVAWGTWHYDNAAVVSHATWYILLVPTVGGMIVGPLVHFFAREAKGHGVPEVMEAVALRSGVMRARLVIVKSLASALSIATGGSVGREGPIAQIGSAIGSVVGQTLKVSGSRLRVLVGCGAAAGVAATFNAPVAGAIFAAEVILGDFAITQFSPIVLSSVLATAVSRSLLGDVPSFAVPHYVMVSPWELALYVLLGLTAGAVGLVFMRVLYAFEEGAGKIPIPPWLLTPIGFFIVGLIGLQYPHVFGVGYEAIEGALRAEMGLGLLAVLLFVKMLATSITISCGGSGGVFAPSLFLGAMTGGLFGNLAHQLFPDATSSPGAYALVGMGSVVAATTHAPLTAFLILFELTSDYHLILPLMVSCIIATLFSSGLRRESIYTMKLLRRGVDIRAGREMNVLRSLRVRHEMKHDPVKIPADETLGALLTRVSDTPYSQFYVVEPDDRLIGVISLSDLNTAIPDLDHLANLMVAREMARTDVPAMNPEQGLDVAIRIFDGRNREELPVVSPDLHRLLGTISRGDIIGAYNRELLRRDVANELGSGLTAARAADTAIRLDAGHSLAEIDVPGEFVGKTIRELDVRGSYGVQILFVRSPGEGGAGQPPNPDTRLQLGQKMLALGSTADLERVRRL